MIPSGLCEYTYIILEPLRFDFLILFIGFISVCSDCSVQYFKTSFVSSASDYTSCLTPSTGNVFNVGWIFLGTGMALGLPNSWTLLIH